MTDTSSTLGLLSPHTRAKHDILRRHLDAWFPILGHSSNRLQYIDGMAGPGEYEEGEPGSPIIALQAISKHLRFPDYEKAGKKFDLLFVEKNRRFVEHLRTKVFETSWPDLFNIEIEHGEFEKVMSKRLDLIDSRQEIMPPTLLFIDPFGSAGFSMQLLRRLATYSRVDVLINFSYESMIHWLLPDPSKHGTLDNLFGARRWQPAIKMLEPERKEFLINEYGKALREVGWKGTDFEMINKQNQTQYFLFFVTRHPRGMQVIKQAMRSVSPEGLFVYRDRTDPAQQRLFGMGKDEEYAKELSDYLYKEYKGRKVNRETLSEEVAWHPRWVEKNLTAALILLEYEMFPSKINSVFNPDGRKRRPKSYPNDCIITFAP